jgi:hypothetical protein
MNFQEVHRILENFQKLKSQAKYACIIIQRKILNWLYCTEHHLSCIAFSHYLFRTDVLYPHSLSASLICSAWHFSLAMRDCDGRHCGSLVQHHQLVQFNHGSYLTSSTSHEMTQYVPSWCLQNGEIKQKHKTIFWSPTFTQLMQLISASYLHYYKP